MKKRILSVALVVCMLLTLVPTAFAAVGDPEVAAYGFVWDAKDPNAELTNGVFAGTDWMGETMYVAFKEAPSNTTNLWFAIDVNGEEWGCCATGDGESTMYAFSFLNRTTQWEKHPNTIEMGADKEHATEYLKAKNNVTSVKLKVYKTEKLFETGNETIDPTKDTLIKELDIAIKSDADTMEEVKDAPVDVAPVFTAATEDVFAGKKASEVQSGTMKIDNVDGKYVIGGVTLKKIEGWEAFNQSLEAEQSGYYVAIAVPKTAGDAEIKGMILTGKDAEGNATEKKYETVEALNGVFTDGDNTKCNIFTHIGNDETAKTKEFIIKLKYGDAAAYTEYKFSCSGVTLETPAATGELRVAQATDISDLGGALVSKLHGDLTIAPADDDNVIKVTGEAKYVLGWDGFSSVAEQQNGHYVALDMSTAEGTKIHFVSPTENPPVGLPKEILTSGTIVTRLENFADAGYKFDVTVGEEDEAVKYTIDLSGVTLKPIVIENVENASIEPGAIGVAYSTGTVSLSGAVEFAADATTAKVALKVTVDGSKYDAEATITKAADGTLSVADVDFYGTALKFETSTLFVKTESEAKPAPAAPEVAPKPEVEDDKTAAMDAAHNALITGKANIDFQEEVLTAAAAKAASEVTTTVKDALAAATVPTANASADLGTIKTAVDAVKANPETADTSSVNLVTTVYMDVAIKAVDVAEAEAAKPTSITFSITPMAQTVLTTVDPEDPDLADIVVYKTTDESDNAAQANAIKVGEAAPVTISRATDVEIPVPFDNGSYVVKHEHDGAVHYYDGTVTDGILSFTSTYGFSDFTVYASENDPRVAQVGDNYYETLAAAIAAVAPNGTITLLKELTGDDAVVTGVKKTINFDLDAGVASDVTLKINGTDIVVTKAEGGTFTYTTPPGGPGVTTYTVAVSAATNGKVDVSPKGSITAGTKVTVTVTPDEGYVLDALTVKNGTADVTVTKNADGTYSFTMPAGNVTVAATFKTASTDLPFTDLNIDAWYMDAVNYVYANGIMGGTTATTFAPNGKLERCMIVTMLYRAEGAPDVEGENKFSDVVADAYYADATIWATENEIVKGYDDGTFKPTKNITRAELVAILYRYAEYKKMDVTATDDLSKFTDASTVPTWAFEAMQWAVGAGIVNGVTDTTVAPSADTTRAQVAKMLLEMNSAD